MLGVFKKGPHLNCRVLLVLCTDVDILENAAGFGVGVRPVTQYQNKKTVVNMNGEA